MKYSIFLKFKIEMVTSIDSLTDTLRKEHNPVQGHPEVCPSEIAPMQLQLQHAICLRGECVFVREKMNKDLKNILKFAHLQVQALGFPQIICW